MKKTIRDVDLRRQTVLVRVDFNVPLDQQSHIASNTRIEAAVPTIRHLTEEECKVVLCSHLGRPKGKVVESLRMAPVGERLAQVLQRPVETADECIGADVRQMVDELEYGDILLLENLRFHPEEEANDENFARSLAALAQHFVMDAFGAAHRAHASTVGVTRFLPSVAGLLLERELQVLRGLLVDPSPPFAAIFGGAKVSDKVGTIRNIMNKVDSVLIGGAMAATFLKATSVDTGESRVETDQVDVASEILSETQRGDVRVFLPVDVVVADAIEEGAQGHVVRVESIPHTKMIVDIGPETATQFKEELESCNTIFWNGPLGVNEIPAFAEGTRSLGSFLGSVKASTIIAGGSTAEVMEDLNLAHKMSFVSTGGGAALQYLAGDPLPAVEALPDKEQE